LRALEDELNLPVVVVAVASGAEIVAGCHALARSLVGQEFVGPEQCGLEILECF
jgi:hypothetical protein